MTVELGSIPALVNDIYDPAFAELLQRNTFFLSRMPAQGLSVERIRWRLHISGNSSRGSYGETDNLGTAGRQDYDEAELSWKLNKILVEITGLAEAVSQGPGFVRNLLSNELSEALPDLTEKLNTEVLSDGTGNSNKDITGIYAAIDDGTDIPIYAGVDRTTQTLWQSYRNDNSGGGNRTLTLPMMRDVKRTVEDHPRNGRVSAIYTGTALWDAYGTLLIGSAESKRGYQDNIMHLAGGYTALDFEGVPVIRIPGYRANRMDFVDERDWVYFILKNFTTEQLAKTKDVSTFFMKHYSQLRCKNPHRQGTLVEVQP